MKRGIFYIFILCVAFLAIGGLIGQPVLTKTMFFLAIGFGLLSLFVFIRQTYLETSRAAQIFKTETYKAINTFKLTYRLETLRLSTGVNQFNAAEKKSKILLKLVRQRFAERSLTGIRFRQEVKAYSQKIMHNLEMAVCSRESMASIDPAVWRDQLRKLTIAGAPPYLKSVQGIQKNLDTYDQLNVQYKQLLAENEELLSQMDKAILALSQENQQLLLEKNQPLMVGEHAFINKFLQYENKL